MRIVVLVKPGRALEESDGCAVEQALRVARRRIDVRVSVLTAGPSSCISGLRAALALGADDGVLVRDEELAAADVLALSRVLAAALLRIGFDLVLAGAGGGEVPNLSVLPVMLAERLDVPVLCHADSLAVRREGVDEVVAVCDDGAAFVERGADLPALVSVTDRAAPPRYPSFPAVAEARRKLISTLTVSELGSADPATARGRAPAVAVVGGTVPCVRARIIVTAGADPGPAAVRLADFLAERHFI